jgi:hypothetical protein
MVNEHWNWLSSIWREEDCDGNSLANIDAKRLGYVQVTIESTDIHVEQDEVAVQVITQGLLSQARRQVLAIAAPVSGKLDHQVLFVEARLATSPSSWPTEDQTLSDEVFEQTESLGTQFVE